MPQFHLTPRMRATSLCTLVTICGMAALSGCSHSRADAISSDAPAEVESQDALTNAADSASIESATAPISTGVAPAWPAQWASRTFFDRPTAYIYAASAAGAKEAEQVMRDASRDFLQFTGAESSKGLIIVTDAKDPLPAEEALLAQIITNRLHAYRTATQPAASPDPTHDPAAEWAKQKKKFDEAGLPIGALLRILPCGIVAADLSQKLGLPMHVARQTPWAVLVPTRAACKRSAHELTQAVMKSKDVTLGQRLLIAPWLPMMESIMTNELAAERVVTLFNEDALSRANWDATRKQGYIGDYRARKNKEREKRISVHQKDMKAKGAPTSMPAK